MTDLWELTVYTTIGAIGFTVQGNGSAFEERLAAALEEGAVLLDTADGSKLLINPVNTVAIEMRRAADTPPGEIFSEKMNEPRTSPFCDRPGRARPPLFPNISQKKGVFRRRWPPILP